MAHQRFSATRLCYLNIILVIASRCLLVLSEPIVQKSASSILGDPNRPVPDYVKRYAPLVWLHSEDPFRPADLLQHIRHTTPTANQKPISDLPDLDLDNLALLNNVSSGQVALTSNDDVTALPDWLFGQLPDESGRIVNATPCVVILVEQSPRDVDAFFFYFYSYDRGANITQVLEPLNRLIKDTEHGMHFGDHVGDWEHNMVRFRDGKPNGIYYSQHSGGAAYAWDHADLSMKDGRVRKLWRPASLTGSRLTIFCSLLFSAHTAHTQTMHHPVIKFMIQYWWITAMPASFGTRPSRHTFTISNLAISL
ncbi:hypothetical protein J3458_006994 [Metarhizium acridum]|uniref:uncharacterized protein n=1 Tax=Metarhizium acridum TaxID=92637 RepID=UPI001C6B488A|nr:hypothetical protein J3458_006994 [Metarhizium acridum]